METVETPQPTAPVEQKSTDWTKIILVAVVGFGLLAGSAYAGYYYGTQQVQPAEELTPAVSQPQPEADRPLDETPEPTIPAIEDETTDWKVLTSPKGYQIKYPTQFSLEERVEGFYVLLENPQNPMGVAFYVDDRGVKTVSERREQKKTDLTDPTFSDLGLTDVDGFVVEGTIASDLGQGEYVKTAYIDLSGRELIFGCEGLFCKSDLFDQILSTFRFLD